jgi:hypothetical protein
VPVTDVIRLNEIVGKVCVALLRLHEENEAMSKVAEAALEWGRTYRLPFDLEGCREHRRSGLLSSEAS